MATSPLFGWEEPDDTDLVKDGAAAIRTLGNAIDTSMGDLLGGTTGQVLSKNSNTNMDFTWVTSDDANAIQNTIVDAKGDLIAATAADTPARLAVGTNGQILTADSTAATGIKWATPATAASGLTFISRTSFSAVASQAFDSVFTSTYKNYLVIIDTLWSTGQNNLQLQMRYAGPTTQTTNYYGNNIYSRANTSTVTNNASSNTSELSLLVSSGSSSIPSRGYFYVGGVGNASETADINGQVNDGQGSYSGSFNGCSSVARTYTGFLLKTASNITGTVSIYGLAAS
jgi:hypothetical protein